MASAKDTFEPKTFGAATFASGSFRGLGPSAIAADVPGVEFRVRNTKLHYHVIGSRLNARVRNNKPQFRSDGTD